MRCSKQRHPARTPRARTRRGACAGWPLGALFGALAAVVTTASFAWGEGKPNLNVQVEVAREVETIALDGTPRVTLEPAREARRGDVLVYTLRYRNLGDAPARQAVLTDPVPEGTVVVRESVAGEGMEITFSRDGSAYGAWPREQRRNPDGTHTWVDAPPSEVKHIRWKLAHAVPPGGSGSATFKVIVQ